MNSEKLYKEWMSRFDAKNPPHMRDAFEAGMEAARPQWHDLRKDPNDLPERINFEESDYVLVAIYTGISWREYFVYSGYYNFIENSWELGDMKNIGNVIAWMPLPEWKGGAE